MKFLLLTSTIAVAGGQQVKQDTEIDGRITTTEIMSSIRAFVSDLFGCSDCR